MQTPPPKQAPKLLRLRVQRDGQIVTIYDERLDLSRLGLEQSERVSHVDPTPHGWVADLRPVNGPTFGPFPRRSQAVDAELGWLDANFEQVLGSKVVQRLKQRLAEKMVS
jgi:hypothetical protein